jgi:Ca2+-binding EF-hand superfamily protein
MDNWRHDLVEAFERFDTDDNNRIDRGEFDKLLDALGSSLSPRDRDLGFGMVDADGDGAITLEELADWWEVVRKEGQDEAQD